MTIATRAGRWHERAWQARRCRVAALTALTALTAQLLTARVLTARVLSVRVLSVRVLSALVLSALAISSVPAQPASEASETQATRGKQGGAKVAPGTSASAALTLEALLNKIGGRPSQQARFVERKYLAVLDAPVESSGILRYQAPGRLEKNTEQPTKESLVLDGDLLIMQRNGRRRTMPAAQIPGVAALVGGIRDTLAGNAQALHRMFKVVLQGDAAQWQLDLLPAEVSSAQLVSKITLRGRDDRLLEVETLQADGDRSVMTLSPA